MLKTQRRVLWPILISSPFFLVFALDAIYSRAQRPLRAGKKKSEIFILRLEREEIFNYDLIGSNAFLVRKKPKKTCK